MLCQDIIMFCDFHSSSTLQFICDSFDMSSHDLDLYQKRMLNFCHNHHQECLRSGVSSCKQGNFCKSHVVFVVQSNTKARQTLMVILSVQ